ncbi:unnamed protein product [Arabis nemorensis]|uniref:(S)-ureidoglycine aminohydrolase cupin domain-containing protein n=1 Tax=Arabis nemorensis TaxID=586526 RepID=A0A565C512_9BRAS|nr:unnamed protein product [Arabis nemorensis]
MGCIGIVNLTSINPYRPMLVRTPNKPFNSRGLAMSTIRAESIATDKLGIFVEKNPPESKLTQLGVRNWPKYALLLHLTSQFKTILCSFGTPEWGCPPSKFPWTYSAKETCYLLEGKVKVYPDGSEEGIEIEAGDFVVFPKGMSCTWDVSVAVDKHYQFE